jgi:hypothetical protein
VPGGRFRPTDMQPIAFPVASPRIKHRFGGALPPRMAHPKDVRCPFVSDEYQHEVERGTCCSEELGDLVEALRALGYPRLAKRAVTRKSPAQALAFAEALQSAVTECRRVVLLEDDPLLPSVDAAEMAAEWYEGIARRGFGVGVERASARPRV